MLHVRRARGLTCFSCLRAHVFSCCVLTCFNVQRAGLPTDHAQPTRAVHLLTSSSSQSPAAGPSTSVARCTQDVARRAREHSARMTWHVLLTSRAGGSPPFGDDLVAKDANADDLHFERVARLHRCAGPAARGEERHRRLQRDAAADVSDDVVDREDEGRRLDDFLTTLSVALVPISFSSSKSVPRRRTGPSGRTCRCPWRGTTARSAFLRRPSLTSLQVSRRRRHPLTWSS